MTDSSSKSKTKIKADHKIHVLAGVLRAQRGSGDEVGKELAKKDAL